jgi:NAD(P)-dependent dehydrogenase (short-subunit alcohol dehydrogenase family)
MSAPTAPAVGALLDMTGRTVVVAGAGGGGIGTSVSGMLARAGATVIGIDNRVEALADFSAATSGASGRDHQAVVADLRDPAAVENAVAAAGDGLYGLVHVAGGMWPPQWAGLMDMDPEVFDTVVELNLRTMMLTSTAVARRLRALGRPGSVVALASVAGLSAMPFGAPYSASKAALMSLVRTAALEWGPLGIRVNAVAPGTVRTPKSLHGNPNPPPDSPAELAAVPLGRRGHADDIAGAVLFLLSDLAKWITGQVLAVDGGSSARPSFLDDDNIPVFVRDEALRARLTGGGE